MGDKTFNLHHRFFWGKRNLLKRKKDTIIQNEYEGFKEILRYTQNDENGRSMVEMLGVLAIIGVLSIAGIAGYKTAMTKYRTNELLEEVTKRTIIVASKISLNGLKAPTTPSTELIDEFTDPKNYGFQVSKENDNQFNILIDAVDESVCTQMKSLIEMDSPIQWISDDCTKLTFNNDLRAEGNTDNNTSTSPSQCPDGSTPAANGTCPDNTCTDNSNCGKDEYCSSSNGTSGTCSAMMEIFHKDGYSYNDEAGTWYDAIAICQRLGLPMASKADIDNSPIHLYSAFWLNSYNNERADFAITHDAGNVDYRTTPMNAVAYGALCKEQ